MTSPHPPKIAERFFEWFCHQNHLEGLEGDLYEMFDRRVRTQGKLKAKIYYVLDMATLIRQSVAKPIRIRTKNNTMSILHNYLKSAVRNGYKRKWFSLINLTGLILGITSVLFISTFVSDELSYDRHITNADQKFRMYNIRYGDDGLVSYLPIVPPVFATSLKENFPQIEKIGRIIYDYGGSTFYIGDQSFSEKNGIFAEYEAIEILDLKLVEGSFKNTEDRYKVFLSQSMFTKFFGDVPFNNQIVSTPRRDLKVAGIYQDIPRRSHLKPDFIYPFELAVGNVSEERMNNWVWQQFFTYLQLRDDVDLAAFTNQMRSFIKERSEPITKEISFHYVPYLQNIRDIHLNSSKFEWEIAERGNGQSVLFLSIAAGIILLIACLNFINLTTVMAIKRIKEVSIRKFIGARRWQLILQYGSESTFYILVAGVVSTLFFVGFLPYFEAFTGKTFPPEEIFAFNTMLLGVVILSLIGFLTGIYPALLITSFNPLNTLRGSAISLGSGNWKSIDFKHFIVGAQYVLSIGLIIISLIISRQYQYLQQKDMGFKKENLMLLTMYSGLTENLESIRNLLSEHNNIQSVSFSYGIPGGIVAGDGVFLPEKSDNEFASNMFMIDHHYIKTMKMDIIAGRDFDPNLTSDASEGFIINETAVKNFGLESPEAAVGEPVHWTVWGSSDSLKRGRIIGVVKDFNFKSLHNTLSSVVLHIGTEYFQNVILRVGSGDLQSTITHVEKVYRSVEPKRPFTYSFVDQTFKEFYEGEKKLSRLFTLFTFLAILTTTIGLLGLVNFTIVNRAKEISIRKVFGASTAVIFKLLVRKYIILVTICLAITLPSSYYLSTMWLQNFAFKVSVNVDLLIKVGLMMIVLTLITVSFHAIRGSLANPAERLRNE